MLISEQSPANANVVSCIIIELTGWEFYFERRVKKLFEVKKIMRVADVGRSC